MTLRIIIALGWRRSAWRPAWLRNAICGGERSPSRGLRIAVVSAAALRLSAKAELRSDVKLLLSVPFTCDAGHSACEP
jgi:hypothetical protein